MECCLRFNTLIQSIATFALVFSVLQLSWQWCVEASLGRQVIELGVVKPAAYLANQLTPNIHTYASGTRLVDGSRGGSIRIANGCDGMETLFLLIAGFVVAPLSWRMRFLGALAGVPLVYVLNQARILGLFYAHSNDTDLFDLLHGVVTPVIMVLSVFAYFYVWLPPSHQTRIAESS